MLALVLVVATLASAAANPCTDACDKAVQTGMKVQFCGLDKQTHTPTWDAIGSRFCYLRCGVSMVREQAEAAAHILAASRSNPGSCSSQVYPGACGCPSDCYAFRNQGQCVADYHGPGESGCKCAPGWGGDDCSLIKCPNACSGNGICTVDASAAAPAAREYCKCKPGFTSFDCSQRTNNMPTLPFGEIYPGSLFFERIRECD